MIMVSRSNILFPFDPIPSIETSMFSTLYSQGKANMLWQRGSDILYKDFKQGRNDFSYLFRIHVLGSVGVTLSPSVF